MKTITIKENWKAPFKSISHKIMRKSLMKFVFGMSFAAGILMGVLSLFQGSFLKSVLIFLFCLIGIPLVTVLSLFLMTPMFLLFKLRTMISPRTYTFNYSDKMFTILKNDKPVVDVPMVDFRGSSLTSPYGVFLSDLQVSYTINGKDKTKKFNLVDIFDEDKLRLYEFLDNLAKLKAEQLGQNTGNASKDTII